MFILNLKGVGRKNGAVSIESARSCCQTANRAGVINQPEEHYSFNSKASFRLETIPDTTLCFHPFFCMLGKCVNHYTAEPLIVVLLSILTIHVIFQSKTQLHSYK